MHYKGLDEDQINSIRPRIAAELQVHFNEEAEEGTGLVFNLHDGLREILSEYNDTVKGRCQICLDDFIEEEELQKLSSEDATFTGRSDLIRID
jgi:hypothetical protein